MALPTTLPAPPTMLGADTTAKQEYFDALNKTLFALEDRATRGPNWFQMAGALLDPGRTGNVGEAIGRAATIAGAQQERQAEMALPIAQVRAQLAGQKYEIENQSKALQLMASTLGISPQQVQQQLQTGSLQPDAMTKLAQIYPVIAQLSPKVGEIVKGTFTMQSELAKQAQEDRKAGMTQADLVAKYGPGVLNLMPGGGMATQPTPVSATQPQPVPSAPAPAVPTPLAPTSVSTGRTPSAYEVATAQRDLSSLMAQRKQTTDPAQLQELDTRIQAAQQVLSTYGITPQLQQGAAPPVIAKPAGGLDLGPDVEGLPLGQQAEVKSTIAKKRIEETDKPFYAKRDEILNSTPQLIEASNTNLRQLDQIARQKPQIFAMLQKEGVIAGLATAAQEGAQLQAGQTTVKLGLPVRQFLEKVKLSEEDQQAVRDVTRILGAEFLANAKTNRGLLGVNPTDNDARLLQAPMVSIDDSAKAVQLWARTQILTNKQRADLYNALSEHTERAGETSSPRKFFSPGSIYSKINKDYAEYRMKLFRQFHPE
jgi:hypothetical protein